MKTNRPKVIQIDGREKLLKLIDRARTQIEEGHVTSLGLVMTRTDNGVVHSIGLGQNSSVWSLLGAVEGLRFALAFYHLDWSSHDHDGEDDDGPHGL